MSIGAISNRATEAPQKKQGSEEMTTVTTKCDKDHQHDQSCPHTVSTKRAPEAGESGYLLDQKA